MKTLICDICHKPESQNKGGMMGEPDFFTFSFTKAFWIGFTWGRFNNGYELNILIPFCHFSFYFNPNKRRER